ncbi:MAG: chemotaxis protein CheW [Clostridiales Family XIII bacterium]|jgi:chemotaxis protein histidine kinase CheA|nr:chemotaxis protein CheW [Clostridiales Family XIII bacterium]
MSDEFNNDSLLELYLYESTSLLDSLDDILLKAESERDLTQENVNEIFRIMHTIKGSSAMMAYTGISEVSHKTEDLFAVIRESGLNDAYFDDLFDIVLAVSDFLKTEVSKIQEGTALETEVAALTDVVLNLTENMRGEKKETAAPDLGRMLGGVPAPPPAPPRQPEPVGLSQPEPAAQKPAAPAPQPDAPAPEPPEPKPEPEASAASEQEPEPESAFDPADMPVAPEGGRILGIAPGQSGAAAAAVGSHANELKADIGKVASRVMAPGAGTLAEPTTYFLHIHFNEGSKMENIRAFMLVNKLSEKGTVGRTIPGNLESNPDAANQIIERGLYIGFTTTLFREQIETLAKGTLSVETVSFVRKLPDDAGDGDFPAAEPAKPEPRPQPIAQTPAPEQTLPPPQAPQIPGAPRTPAVIVPPQQSQPPGAPRIQTSAPAAAISAPTPAQAPRPVFVAAPAVSAPPPAVSAAPAPQAAPQAAPTQPTLPQPVPSAPIQKPAAQTKPGPGDTAAPGLTDLASKQSFISVDLKKLDALLDLVGEIVINESTVTENPDLDGLELSGFRKAAKQLDKLTNELQDTVMSIRMLPVSMVFQRMRRIVRDMSKSLGKEAELVLVGETTEVDKTILDALTDPIMHLVRNAMDHAIELSAERGEAGKNPVGHIVLSAQNSGGDVIISVSDDGKGLDKNVILDKARAKGLLRKPESEYSDKEIYNLLMAPGFSTKENVTEYSGRGVGMDVVKSNIEKIGGTVIIESKLGQGTHIILKIPLTLAIISCMEISVGNDIYSIPINNIKESFKASAGQLITDPLGNEMIMLRGMAYPIVRLYEVFGKQEAIKDLEAGILVLADAGDKSVCMLADELIGKFQVVVKPLPRFLKRFNIKTSGISGCTIMGNGSISLIINVQELVE